MLFSVWRMRLARSSTRLRARPSYVGPVIVNILKRRVPPPDLIEVEVTELTRTIAGILDRPHEHVHLKYESDAIGRVAYGGKLVN
jgi:hypothetical protein